MPPVPSPVSDVNKLGTETALSGENGGATRLLHGATTSHWPEEDAAEKLRETELLHRTIFCIQT